MHFECKCAETVARTRLFHPASGHENTTNAPKFHARTAGGTCDSMQACARHALVCPYIRTHELLLGRRYNGSGLCGSLLLVLLLDQLLVLSDAREGQVAILFRKGALVSRALVVHEHAPHRRHRTAAERSKLVVVRKHGSALHMEVLLRDSSTQLAIDLGVYVGQHGLRRWEGDVARPDLRHEPALDLELWEGDDFGGKADEGNGGGVRR
jgi:hypothetical protein